MDSRKISTVVLAVSFIAACSASDPPPPPVKQGTVFDPLTQQLDRARGVQQSIDASAEANRAAVDNQERGDASP